MLCFLLLVYYLSSSTCSELLRRHRRNWIIDSYSIEEEHKGPFPYELGKIDIDRDYVIYFNLNGHGVDKEPKGVLSINSTSGTIWVHKAVDYEARPQLELKFQARRADSTIDTRLGVEISILDINDNPPRFDKDQFDISVPEDLAQGYLGMTMVASDKDKSGTPNSTFHYEIKSVSPKPADSEFFIEKTGSITFKGCLDHEASKKISIVIEVKDHGEVVSLSSSATVVIHVQDSNDHLPTISGQTGPDKVKEETKGSSPLRLHVTDQDTRNSPAWRARFTIHGDEGGHFKIETDPVTNDGILTVVKPLDFEKGAQRELSISVENETPYFFCKVKERTSSGPWTVESSKGDHASAAQPHTVNVTIEVEDVNDPPKFRESVKKTVVKENAPTGTWLGNVTAVDKDSSHTNTFVYKVGHDPADWVTVDPHTGNITTVKRPDRESPFVVNGVYTVILHAVDNGEPPLTGTCTLQIYVIDQNDNAPQPEVQHFDVCMSNMSTTANITASDLDGDPFGGPFTFELLGDVKGKWKLRPSYGYTAGLVKEPGLYAGQHTIDLKITDMQGEFGVYNLSVTVCDCSLSANCRTQRKTAAKADFGAIGIVFASLLALLFVMLMAIICSHKKEFTVLEMESAGNTLLKSNTEKPGTDCKVYDNVLAVFKKHQAQSNWQTLNDGMHRTNVAPEKQSYVNGQIPKVDYTRVYQSHPHMDGNQMIGNYGTTKGHRSSHQPKEMGTMNSLSIRKPSFPLDETILNLLHQKLTTLQETEGNRPDALSHLYAEEGNDDDDQEELDKISIPDDESFEKTLQNLDPKFNKLASICKPQDILNRECAF